MSKFQKAKWAAAGFFLALVVMAISRVAEG